MALTLQQRGAAFFRSKLPQVAKETVRYVRGSLAIEELEIISGRSEIESYHSDEIEGTYRAKDWYVDEAKLSFGGPPTRPEKGDQIHVPTEFGFEVWEVLPIPGNRDHETVDERLRTVEGEEGDWIRVHTKLLEGKPLS